jgi:hypothetical protein
MLFEQLGHVAAYAVPEILEFMLFILLMKRYRNARLGVL